MEWQVVTVIIALVGLFFTVAKPIINLTNTISKLDHTCERLDSQFITFQVSNKERHRRIWYQNDGQVKAIYGHETRITTLELAGRQCG